LGFRGNGFESWQAPKRGVETSTASGGLRSAASRIWIEGMPILLFGRGEDCAFAGCLQAATAVSRRPFSSADFMGGAALALTGRPRNEK
jgi:hypothetical protein